MKITLSFEYAGASKFTLRDRPAGAVDIEDVVSIRVNGRKTTCDGYLKIETERGSVEVETSQIADVRLFVLQ